MSQRALLIQSLLGHLALLQQKHPAKANSPVALALRRSLTGKSLRPKTA